jgi:ubiquinone/menaquinone biosynthesis C-methylase UbiE
MSTSSTVISERIERYILDGSEEDLRRLLRIAKISEDAARTALRRVGAQDGWTAIDCGCGPIGALTVLAEIVGPNGHVVGVDFSEPSLSTARSVIAALGLENAEVLPGDVNARAVEGLAGGRFDLAFTRCFLIHQPDPAHTLGRIAELLRPGGKVVVQEPLRSPPPRSSPHCGALTAYWELIHEVMESAGTPHHTTDGLPACAREAGLEVINQSGFFGVVTPQLGFDLHASTLAAAKDRAIQSGRTTEDRVDELVSELRAAAHDPHDWVSTPFYLDLALQKPVAAHASD